MFMRHWVRFSVLLAFLSAAPVYAKVAHKHAEPKRHASGKKVATRSTTRKTGKVARGRGKAAGKRYASRGRSSRRRAIAARQPARQAIPSSDRYKEIQEALAQKGYLTTPPNGIWDQNAQDALRKFQADQNLTVSGKLSSRSIIALGLGSPTAAVPPANSSSPTPPKP